MSTKIVDKLPGWLSRSIHKHYSHSPHDVYAAYPNPFLNYAPASKVAKQKEINLVDGGESHQNIPIWPFLQPERRVDVLIVSDNSGETDHYPVGKSLHNTYTSSKAAGLTKMPEIPEQAEFVAKGLNKGPRFFGCHTKNKITIIYLPNEKYSFSSNVATFKLKYTTEETAGKDPPWKSMSSQVSH